RGRAALFTRTGEGACSLNGRAFCLMVMLADPKLRSQVESLWDKLWSGGLSNPLDAIEQLSFLLFLKQLDEREQDAERAAKKRGKQFEPLFVDKRLRGASWA